MELLLSFHFISITQLCFLSNLFSTDFLIFWLVFGGVFGALSTLTGAKRFIGGKVAFLLGFVLGPLGLGIVLCSNKKQPYFVFPMSFDSVPDQIRKYKELLDSGAITEAEYELQKTKLLN